MRAASGASLRSNSRGLPGLENIAATIQGMKAGTGNLRTDKKPLLS